MIRVEERGLLEGSTVGSDGIRLSLLQLAKDTVFFSKPSLESLQNLKLVLLVFGQLLGLKMTL